MVPVNAFGKEIKKRLIDLEKTQTWLVEQVRERVGGSFDSSWLHRIMTGRVPSERSRDGVTPSKAKIIREILGIDSADQ